MSGAVVWLHGDSLTPTDPALLANPAAPAVFVFDEPFLTTAQLSFKRLFFLYECALEAIAGREGSIRRGVVVDEVRAFAAEHQATEVHVTASVAPRFRQYVAELRNAGLQVVIHELPPFVLWRGAPPRRFSAFWRQVADQALRPTGSGPELPAEQDVE
ncbi:MAG: deoxyribodipyrimidine photo-lyase [Chloroflexus sp.]|nr:deoxyribodipyrimidine photo-lyase [Chloroflexus sp.]